MNRQYRNETALTNAILAEHGARQDLRVWRNETSGAWVGKYAGRDSKGRVIIENGRLIQAGLAKGSADLIGIQSRLITEDDVGKTIGQFVSAEVKQPRGRLRKDQKVWADVIRAMGGKADIVRSPDEMLGLLDQEDS